MNVFDGRMTSVAFTGSGDVVAAEVGHLALHGEELGGDGLLVGGQLLGERRERRRQLGIGGLRGQLLGPVERQVEVAAAVVELVDLAARATCSPRGTCRWRGRACRRGSARRLLARGLGQVLEAGRQREELAEAVPAEVVLLHELLHVLRGRPAGAGLEEPAAVDERHDRQHLGAGAELHDREQVGEVVAQHVAGAADGVLAAADALERARHRVDRRLDLDLEAVGVVVGQVRLHLGDEVGVVGAASRRARTPPARRWRGPG